MSKLSLLTLDNLLWRFTSEVAKGIYIKEKAYSTRLRCSKLGWDNPGLVQNFISDLKSLEEKSVQFFFFNVVIKCSEEKRYNYPKQALEQRNWRNLRFVL